MQDDYCKRYKTERSKSESYNRGCLFHRYGQSIVVPIKAESDANRNNGNRNVSFD